ncbi:MAG: TolC family protein [Proteobacteria bacterium]|nr:TolC family protein [Pseudomonadota bacterium]
MTLRQKKRFSLFFLLSVCHPASHASGLSLDEAVTNARNSLPIYQASQQKVAATEALYTASLSPYLPTIDGSASENQHHSSAETYNSKNYKVAVSYTVFDGGKRLANRKIAGSNLTVDQQETRKSEIELVSTVTTAFYSAIAQRDIVKQRNLQFQFAEKDHNIAKGRHKLGYVKLSDVLQASVRLEQARFNIIEAEGDYRKALSELNSLMGLPLQDIHDLTGSMNDAISPPDESQINEAAKNRPEIIQARTAIDISKDTKLLAKSAFYPVVSASAAHDKNDSELYQTSYPEEQIIGFSANWNFFEWGKYYKVVAARHEVSAAELRLQEAQRKVLLDLSKAKDDFITSSDMLKVADQQIVHAEHNYNQALGEYKAGKGDILSLVQAESLLADAKGQLITAKLDVILSKVQWEKVAGLSASDITQ